MCAPRVNGMITSNGSARDVSVGEERKKWGWGIVKVAPERIESFAESWRDRRGGSAAKEGGGGKGWGDSRLLACLQEPVAQGRGIHRRIGGSTTRGWKGRAHRGGTRVSGLTAKPDRPCFYLKTTLLRRSRRRREEGVARLWKGFLLADRLALEGLKRRRRRRRR